jgi:hypothetical protein
LWAELLLEASRFDGRRLVSIFGDNEPDNEPIHPRRLDVANLTERDRLLVGEFVRRHHCRLAHEIAIWGVPALGLERLQFVQIPPELADLSGLVARSHGTDLRNTYDYLGSTYHLREFQGVHAVFLMGVLRVADYLQIHEERAERRLLKIKRLVSPLSQEEWRAHHAIPFDEAAREQMLKRAMARSPEQVREHKCTGGTSRRRSPRIFSTGSGLPVHCA